MKKSRRSMLLIPMVLLIVANMAITCEEVVDCLCPDGNTGNAKVDALFVAAAELENASLRVQSKTDAALADLAAVVGLPETATPDEVAAAVCNAFSSATIEFNLEVEEPKCEANIDVAARVSAECDVTIDPGTVEINCEGYCEGSCQGECSAECTMPSVSAHCEGSCHGSCTLESSVACYGTCHGECSGTCSVMEGGQCAGSCDGTCTGYCEVTVKGSCSGSCSGECVIDYTPGGCSGRCEGSCSGHCEGSCEGHVEPPSVDAECKAQVEARVEASVECEPPKVDFGIDASGMDNISEIGYHIGRLMAATREADRVFEALGAYHAAWGGLAAGLINGELTAEDAACFITDIDVVANSLTTAQASLQYTIEIGPKFGPLMCVL